jgi:hypothetical protein
MLTPIAAVESLRRFSISPQFLHSLRAFGAPSASSMILLPSLAEYGDNATAGESIPRLNPTQSAEADWLKRARFNGLFHTSAGSFSSRRFLGGGEFLTIDQDLESLQTSPSH